MAYSITQADLDSITDHEVLHHTTRLLPEERDIPAEFWQGNVYTRLAQAIHFNEPPPAGKVSFHAGFRADAKALQRCILAHILSVEPSYEHKTAGVGYLIAQIITIT